MKETFRCKAIIINRKTFREKDILVSVLSEERGKEDLIARGAKKLNSKMASHLEPLNYVDVMVVVGKNFNYVGSVESIKLYRGIKKDLDKIGLVGKCTKLINKITFEGGLNKDVFRLYFGLLEVFEKCGQKDLDILCLFYLIKMLSLLGYMPELSGCIYCHKKLAILNRFKFSLHEGGLVCDCTDIYENKNSLKISKEAILTMRNILSQRSADIVKKGIKEGELKEISNTIKLFYSYQLNITL